MAIPDRLRAPTNNGTYMVQARGPMTDQFRAMLRNANATIVSYIPNNAVLVRVADAATPQLLANALTQSVLPYEPYYKLEPSLLKLAIEDPDGLRAQRADGHSFWRRVSGHVDGVAAIGRGSDFRRPLAVRAGVQGANRAGHVVVGGGEFARRAGSSRAAHARSWPMTWCVRALGVTADSVTKTNYLGLTGSNVLVNINDTGVDSNASGFCQPHAYQRLCCERLLDTNGHGTHVAGTILGNGSQSATVTNQQQGSVTNANFRGMATNATAFVMSFDIRRILICRKQAARTNAFISNNSWNYGSSSYDIAAASYDAAVRDALPEVTGSQPLVYVFSAGNDGGGFLMTAPANRGHDPLNRPARPRT